MKKKKVIKKKPTLKTVVQTEAPVVPEVKESVQQIAPPEVVDTNVVGMGQAKKGKIWTVVFVLLIGLAAAGGIFIYRSGLAENLVGEKAAEQEVVVTPTPIPTPTPEVIDKSKYKIEVLNGSGIKGEAGRVKALLEKEGYVVLSIGNSETQDYEKTVIKAGSGVPEAFVAELKEVLEGSYVLGSTAELEAGGESDVVVIVGLTKAEE